MEIINYIFHSVSCLFALLAAIVLIFVNKDQQHSNRLLALILILFAVQHILLMLLFTGYMLKVPWLVRVFAPTTFLIAPAAYLYFRSVVHNEMKFKKWDFLLCIPALLTIINFLPYYLLPLSEKIELLQQTFYSQTPHPDPGIGYLPSNVFYGIRILWSAIWIIMGYRLLIQFKKSLPEKVLQTNTALYRWLFTFNLLLTAILLTVMMKIFIPVLKNSTITPSDILLGITVLVICLQLFFKPQILYGVYFPISMEKNFPAKQSQSFLQHPVLNKEPETVAINDSLLQDNIDLETAYRYKQLLETHFHTHKPYLNSEYSLDRLVYDLRIPRYTISAFINREYGMGFREFINRYRVDYFKENCTQPHWKQYTIEAMAAECGFASRITFIKNFKEITQMTPSDYVKEVKKGKS
jgi:AraC-like DNA-binding protein